MDEPTRQVVRYVIGAAFMAFAIWQIVAGKAEE